MLLRASAIALSISFVSAALAADPLRTVAEEVSSRDAAADSRLAKPVVGYRETIRLLRRPAAARGRAALVPVAPIKLAVRRVPAEFERQQAILLCCREMLDNMPELFLDVVAALRGHVEIVVAVNDAAEYRFARRLMAGRDMPEETVRFVEASHDTMWARDYGPMVLRLPDGAPALLDADYSSRGRPADDALPIELSHHLRVPVVPVPRCVDGGNLITNGRGLALATYELLNSNPDEGPDEEAMNGVLREMYGFDRVVYLEALLDEPTGHVDMFATFTSHNTVVVGAYDPKLEPENAAVLERNAEKLSRVRTRYGRLRVIRVPMPPPDGTSWPSYTNVVYANGVVLVPVFPGSDAAGRRQALQTFSRLLPGWRIAAIDARPLAELGGGLHCVTMNLGMIGKLPEFPRPSREPAREIPADLPDDLAGRDVWNPLEEEGASPAFLPEQPAGQQRLSGTPAFDLPSFHPQ